MAERERDDRRNPYYFGKEITNSLGLQAQAAKGTLKAYALSEPVAYTEMRNKVYTQVLEDMVCFNYEIIWSLLSTGLYKKTQIFRVKGDTAWSPNLPDHQIAKIANAFSESTMEAFEKIMAEVLPADYKDLSESRQAQANKIAGVSV